MLDISTFWLKINYFFLSHKDDFKKWWVIVLIAVDIFIVVFVFTNLVIYWVGIAKQNKLLVVMATSSIDYQVIKEKSRPQSLEIISTTVLPASNDKYDLVTLVKNNNKNWAVTAIDYKFIIKGVETDRLTDFILPNTEKYLTALGVGGSGSNDSVDINMEIESMEWKKVVHPEQLSVTDFMVENVEYSSTMANELTVYRVKADITNAGYRSFWQTRFIVVLYSGEKIARINYVYFDQFRAGEQRSLYAQWESVPSSISGVAILPDFNLLDEENIIK